MRRPRGLRCDGRCYSQGCLVWTRTSRASPVNKHDVIGWWRLGMSATFDGIEACAEARFCETLDNSKMDPGREMNVWRTVFIIGHGPKLFWNDRKSHFGQNFWKYKANKYCYGEFLYNCETNDRNVSAKKWPKCLSEKKQQLTSMHKNKTKQTFVRETKA